MKSRPEEEIPEPNPADNKPLCLNEDEDIILTKERLETLKGNTKITQMLKNKKLASIIKHIDSTKYKKKTLEKMLLDPEFRLFADEILTTLGFLKDNTFTY